MDKNSESPDFDAIKAELFEAISHPLRIRILEALNEKPMGFAELGRAVGIGGGGHLAFHLNKLRHLVKMNKEGNYELTGDGKEALWSVNVLQRSTAEVPTLARRPSVRHRSLLKPILAIVIASIVVLGGASAYEQREYAFQQQQLATQQKLIGILQNGLPFTNAQSAALVLGQHDFTSYDPATSASGLNNPTDIVFDSTGNMWVTEFTNDRVLEFKQPFNTGMKASLVIGQKDFTSATPSVTRAGLGEGCGNFGPCGPNSAAFDSSGNLWVADFGASRILEYVPPFSSGMNASLVIGQKDFNTGGSSMHGIPSSVRQASRDRLFSPTAIAFDQSGNLWVLDMDNNRVLEFKLPFSNGMNAAVVLGQANFTGAQASSRLNGLACQFGYVATDVNGDVWVGDDQNNRIVEFKPPFSNGMNASLVLDKSNLAIDAKPLPWNSGNLGWLISFDAKGNLWASSNDRLLVFKPPFTAGVRSFPALEIGQPNLTSTVFSGGQNGFGSSGGAPSGMGFDSAGDLWVADSSNNRVLEFLAGPAAQSAPVNGQSPLWLGSYQFLMILSVSLAAAGFTTAFFLLRKRK